MTAQEKKDAVTNASKTVKEVMSQIESIDGDEIEGIDSDLGEAFNEMYEKIDTFGTKCTQMVAADDFEDDEDAAEGAEA